MNLKRKAAALLLCGISAVSVTACGSQTFTTTTKGIKRTIKVTDGELRYDDNDLLDGFYNGCATATRVYYESDKLRYYKFITTDAKTDTNNFLKWSCTSDSYQKTAVSRETNSPKKSASGLINFRRNIWGNYKISRIYYTAASENYT